MKYKLKDGVDFKMVRKKALMRFDFDEDIVFKPKVIRGDIEDEESDI